MRKMIVYWLFAFFFTLSGNRLYPQTPKLTGAFAASFGIAVDSKGNVFVTGKNGKIIKIDPQGRVELFAGGGRNGIDGTGKEAGFSATKGIAIDSADNLYVVEGRRIRKISPAAVVTTLAGTMTAAVKDGDRQTAAFWNPENIAIDKNGVIYVTDHAVAGANTGDYCIRKINEQGDVTTIKEGATNWVIRYPRGLACDAAGNLYVCCNASHCVRKISPAGMITTFAGQCDKTVLNSVYKEGPVNTAVLTTPGGIALANNGDVYISDPRLHRIIKIANNKVTTVAGAGKFTFSGNPAGAADPGYIDGKALSARFDGPEGIAFDNKGNLFIIDRSYSNNSYIRKLSPDGMVTTFCKHEWNPKTSQYEEVE